MPAMENNSRSGGEVPPAQKMQDMVTQLFTQQTLEQVQAKLEDWDSRLQGISIFDQAHKATNVKRVYLGIGGSILILMFVFFGFGMKFLTTLVGFAIPAYQSFKAIESRGHEEDSQWLSYWVVFGFLELIENFVGFILTWIPFYYTLKLLFVIALQVPQFRGAEFVYNHFLRGFLRMYEKKIDKVAEHGYGVMSQATEALGGSALLEKSNAAASGSGHDRAQAYDQEARDEDDSAPAAKKDV